MNHFTSDAFWRCYHSLPQPIQKLAGKNLKILKTDPHHPSLHFKKIGKYRSIRIGLAYRAVAVENPDGLVWSGFGLVIIPNMIVLFNQNVEGHYA